MSFYLICKVAAVILKADDLISKIQLNFRVKYETVQLNYGLVSI